MNNLSGLRHFAMRVIAAASMLFAASHANAEVTLTINGYGGAPWDAINKFVHEPYTKETGVKLLNTTQPNLAQLKEMVESGNMTYEALELNGQEYATAVQNGWLEKIDWALADPQNKQPPEAKREYGMVYLTFSTTMAYRTDTFPEGKGPKNWTDFWNVKDFPGPRAMQNSVITNLEFALMADGVPREDVYKVLATDEGVDRAFRKIAEIKPHVVKWWTAGAEPIQLLADGEVVMAQAWSGRIYELSKSKPVKAVWNQGILDVALLCIPKGNKLAKETMQYFSAWSHADRVAEWVKVTPYPNLLSDLGKYLPPELTAELPSTNANVQLLSDDTFWISRRDKLTERWNEEMLQ